ncbi:12088_t:CDS:1, partial [Entrophospora sp. SA101]
MEGNSNRHRYHSGSYSFDDSNEANFDRQSEVKDEAKYGTCQRCMG